MKTMRKAWDGLHCSMQGTCTTPVTRTDSSSTLRWVMFLLVLLQCVQGSVSVVHRPGGRNSHLVMKDHGRKSEQVAASQESAETSFVINVDSKRDETYRVGLSNNDRAEKPPQAGVAPPSARQVRWADAAFAWVSAQDCSAMFFTTERECRVLKRQPRSAMTIHTADPTPRGQLAAVLTDGGLGRSGQHDAVVVLDPYSAAEYGHLVLVFYVDLHVTKSRCEEEGGTFLDQECMTLALKRRCKNIVERRGRRRHFARRCEINFLPRVYLVPHRSEEGDGAAPASRENLLQCRGALPGFAPCPELRPRNETAAAPAACDPIHDNTQRCATTHDTVHTSCRVFEICDQAVILSGGWDERLSLPRHQHNVHSVYHMLRQHGFKRNNIQVFFANGGNPIQVTGEHSHRVHPSTQKLAMRYHVQGLCGSLHCAESLVLYLNSPTRSDGTMLLWDQDQDGEASERERYSVEELLSDLADCQARHVYVIADQSYSGTLVRALRRSQRHHNVAAFASSKEHQYAWRGEFTRLWTSLNHTQTCMHDAHKEVKKRMHYSTPDVQVGRDVSRATLFGAPCDVIPPFTHRELRQTYLGCQNLPTALWVAKWVSSVETPDMGRNQGRRPSNNRAAHHHRVNSGDQASAPNHAAPRPSDESPPPTLFRRHKGL